MPIQSPLEKTLSRYPALGKLLDRDDWQSRFLQDMKIKLENTGYLTPNQAVTSCRIMREVEIRARS